MSDQELERNGFYEQNGRKKHRDRYGIWDINDKGWENLFFNQIVDTELAELVEALYDNNDGSERIQFEHNGEKMNIWVKPEKAQSSVSRKLQMAKDTQVIDTMTTNPKMGAGDNLGGIPDSIKKIMDETKASSSSGAGGFKGPKGYFKSDTYQFGTLSEFKRAVSENSNVRALTPKEMNPTNYLIHNGVEMEINLWWGIWTKIQ